LEFKSTQIIGTLPTYLDGLTEVHSTAYSPPIGRFYLVLNIFFHSVSRPLIIEEGLLGASAAVTINQDMTTAVEFEILLPFRRNFHWVRVLTKSANGWQTKCPTSQTIEEQEPNDILQENH
jgi:hypothetical protein